MEKLEFKVGETVWGYPLGDSDIEALREFRIASINPPTDLLPFYKYTDTKGTTYLYIYRTKTAGQMAGVRLALHSIGHGVRGLQDGDLSPYTTLVVMKALHYLFTGKEQITV